MSLADEMLPSIADAFIHDPKAYKEARDALVIMRDRVVAHLDYELSHPGPFYDAAEDWSRKAAEFGFAEDVMDLAEVLIRCADQRQKSDPVRGRQNIAEAASIFEIYANAGIPRAMSSLAQIVETLAASRAEREAASNVLLFAMPAGSC